MRLIHLLATAGLLLGMASARAGDLYVVTLPSVAVAPEDIRDIFLGEKQFSGSAKLTPVENGSLQAEFQARVLHLDAARYATIWSKKGFRDGISPPPMRNSDAEVIHSIKAYPGTIGYVSMPTPDVKVIQKF